MKNYGTWKTFDRRIDEVNQDNSSSVPVNGFDRFKSL